MSAKCPQCGQAHPGDSVCEEVLEKRYGTLGEPSETMADTVERDRDD